MYYIFNVIYYLFKQCLQEILKKKPPRKEIFAKKQGMELS